MWISIFGAILFGIFLYQAYRFFRLYPKITWILFTTLPILLLPWWIHHHPHTWFGWAKIYSVALGVIVIQFCRSPRYEGKSLPFAAAYAVLLLNIAEATLNDFLAPGWDHRVNGIAGLLLMATMTTTRAMGVEKREGVRDFAWRLPMAWVWGYTFWNLNFVYMNYAELTLVHVAVLGSALVVALYKPSLWFQARALTLGTYLMIDFSYKPLLRPIYSEGILNHDAALAFSLFCVAWMAGFAIVKSVKSWRAHHPTLLLHH